MILTRNEWKTLGRAIGQGGDGDLPMELIPWARLALVHGLNAAYSEPIASQSVMLALLVKLSSEDVTA